ncbi:uncharacterized protein Z518_07386 [Rhinocladiella mackenziei CBS 650.93]|uniref:NUDE domain-containing protein n=1 Tax=Rhinocladiella mackenziei CBS 650.93 TaxID=1442369 RepID=A0A0D2H073_9EURO|nr:uncharacterized protein Z518_07386 [Rhinocladiella mackenziei CBS 650.93]KIX03833.1 hypothetical protein Z518_07386 [Rhinocladiella mackenziei CBS 650.93]
MPLSDGVPSSPPGPSTSLEDSLKYYKAQYELLEAELADFQASSKDLEAELEKDIEASEKRERQLKEKTTNLQYEVDEWKTKYKQSKTEASNVQNALQKEITELRDTNRTLTMRLRDIEVANDDYERKQRNTESSLEDMESKYNQAIERSVLLEEEIRTGDQEREDLRIEAQRLRDELSDLKIETDITKEKLRKAIESAARPEKNLTLQPIAISASPRSELSPTTTNASSPTFDTPPAQTASSSGLSDTPTPPSPPISDKSANAAKSFATPGIPKTRLSTTSNPSIQRPSTAASTSKPNNHARGPSIPTLARTGPSSSLRQSLSRPGNVPQRPAGLPHSTSIIHLRNLRGKMQKLEERVQTARSKLPAPVNTPPRMSPRSGSALGNHIPSSVTVRSRKRTVGSGTDSLPDKAQETPSIPKSKPSRSSLGQPQQPPSPTRTDMAAPPFRPSSRTSGISGRSSFAPSHSRPGSRASVTGIRAPLGSGVGSNFAPNASTDRVRPKSSLSSYGYDGVLDEENIDVTATDFKDATTPTPRRTTFAKRTSDVGSSIPSPVKRTSLGGATSKLPSLTRRQSSGIVRVDSMAGDMRPPSRQLNDVKEGYDLSETF